MQCAGPGADLATSRPALAMQKALLAVRRRWTHFSRGSLLQGIRQEEGKYRSYRLDAPFPKAAASRRSRRGVARLDACSLRKRILAGAVPSPRSIPRPLLPRIPLASCPAPLQRCSCPPAQNGSCGQVAQVCVPSSSCLTCSDLLRGSRICPFLSGFNLPGEKGEKGSGKGKHSLGSCKSRQPKG